MFEQNNLFIDGFGLQGSVTYTDPRIESDPVFPAAEGKRIPQVPSWRTTLVATYRPNDDWVFTLAARYSSRVYATIDNSDIALRIPFSGSSAESEGAGEGQAFDPSILTDVS